MAIENGVVTTIAIVSILIVVKSYFDFLPEIKEWRKERVNAEEREKTMLDAIKQNSIAMQNMTTTLKEIAITLRNLEEDRKLGIQSTIGLGKIIEVIMLDTKDTKEDVKKIDDKVDRLHTQVARANAKMELLLTNKGVDINEIEKKINE
ncbi:hypothetical protein [Microaceticoccus formicicus]|uniref:hypothetical protein n=1 Tax=Microaceticoccus formicicus TaxID=3118105 RepID=UPI003CD04AF5|nr:hypothetical protein VZL98_05035 [Peptoniphilaceae bacterium AMB_02]